ncbi:MAG: hypothetical protein H0V35_03820 [Nitrospira sp.]|nr:hypothetical protein [Nitrospira sp.]
MPQIFKSSNQDFRGATDQGGGVQSGQGDLVVLPVRESGPQQTLVKRDGPFHAGDTADTITRGIGDRFHFIDL